MDTEIRVLIADDEQIARETMRDYLPWAEMGMQTPICVENGALALDHLCHDKIDIFIMDIRMPILGNCFARAMTLSSNHPEVDITMREVCL